METGHPCYDVDKVQPMSSGNYTALPVHRSKQDARRFYDRLSRLYGHIAGPFEHKYAKAALQWLAIQNGESVLEIGFGTGHCLEQIARLVGPPGTACGIDISPGMLRVARRRLQKTGLIDRVELHCEDATQLPYNDNTFDAAFIGFTLELFDNPEIPQILAEIRRVLKPNGRLGVVSMSRSYGRPAALRLYEWAHQRWPRYVDCRPIYVEDSLTSARYEIKGAEKAQLAGLLPLEIVIAAKTD